MASEVTSLMRMSGAAERTREAVLHDSGARRASAKHGRVFMVIAKMRAPTMGEKLG
jgi:hypothetical protein